MRILNTIPLVSLLCVAFATLPCRADSPPAVKEVAFPGAGGLELQGTLALPACANEKGCPAMLLLPGSGPTDRNGNLQTYIITNLLAEIADRFAAQGVATLRYDKRAASNYASRWPKEEDAQNEFFSWDSFVGDAEAGLRYLASQPGVDGQRIGVLGHSEGGLIALQLAARRAEGATPRFLVLASTPGRKLTVALDEQLRTNLTQNGLPKDEVDKLIAKNAEIVKAAIATGRIPDDVPDILKSMYSRAFGKYVQKYLALEPARLAAEFPGPVLVLQGDKDAQQDPTLEAKALEAALASRKSGKFQVTLVPDASHNLKHVDVSSDPGFKGPVATEAMEPLLKWMKEVTEPK